MKNLTKIANSKGPVAVLFRAKRFEVFKSFLSTLDLGKKINILDVGGVPFFWEQMGFDKKENIEITILNLKRIVDEHKASSIKVKLCIGDGCNMQEYSDGEFDIVYSNSVIEHVGSIENQDKMAKEIQRVGKSFFVQTPNYWFPLEPHFLVPCYQFLPSKIKAFLLRRFNLGWFKKAPDYSKSIQLADSIRLLCKSDLKRLFPGAYIEPEKFLGLTKSWMIYKNVSLQ